MMNAVYISAIGLQAQQEQLDASAGNLANLSTPGYKRRSVDFSALLDRAPATADSVATVPADANPGRSVRLDFTPGALHPSGRALDLAINGSGFVEIELPGGTTGYSRAGSLQVNADGGLSLAGGLPLKADVRVPGGAGAVQIQPDGRVMAVLAGDSTASLLGQIELATFANPESLQYRGDGVFTAPEGSEPTHARPGEDGTGTLAAGYLEGSNVRMVDEMVSLLLMQRIYELNSRVLQVADEMTGMANNLRRG